MNKSIITPNSLKQIEGIEVSLYNRLIDKTNTPITISEVFKIIKDGLYIKDIIESLRKENIKSKITALKETLPAITVSALFKGQRKAESIIKYTEIICLDFDNVSNLEEKKQSLKNDLFCLASFLSPYGKGLKVFVKVDGNYNTHKDNVASLSNYFLKKYAIEADKSCKDVTRLMFLSYDEDLYVNYNSKIWSINQSQHFEFESLLSNLEKQENFKPGNRNNFIFRLACECCKNNVSKKFAEEEILNRFTQKNFDKIEILKTIQSGYNSKNNNAEKTAELKKNEHLLWERVEKYLDSKYEIRLNEVSTKIEYRKTATNNIFEELNENTLYRELQKTNLSFPLSKLTSLLQSDFVKKYNPFVNYFISLEEWDHLREPDYITKLTAYIPTKDGERFLNHFKKMLVRCIACSLENNVFNKQIFVLVHSMQNSGKSTFLRWLCPEALMNYYTEYINPDKDGMISLATNFIINLDELTTYSKYEINAFKSLISKDKINVRLPFAKRTTLLPRRANFFASTNKDEFLNDETGSVRWLCIELTAAINFGYKNDININDIWRQAYSLYKSGFEYQLTLEEVEENENTNKVFQTHTLEMDLIPKYFRPASKDSRDLFYTPTEIMQKIIGMDVFIGSKISANGIGRALKVLGFTKSNKYSAFAKQTLKGYYIELVES